MEAYTQAVERRTRPTDVGDGVTTHSEAMGRFLLHGIYYNRGNAFAAAGRHDEAVLDYDRALARGSVLRRSVLFNRGNSKYALECFAGAFEDFMSAWSEHEGSDAALAAGNCKTLAGEFEEGMKRYWDGVRVGVPERTALHCRRNARILEEVLGALGSSDYEVRREGNIVYVGCVEAAGEAGLFTFAGNQGNAGNTPSGMVTAPGGKGYEGGPGFKVFVEAREN